jgi:hypothetical protein
MLEGERLIFARRSALDEKISASAAAACGPPAFFGQRRDAPEYVI